MARIPSVNSARLFCPRHAASSHVRVLAASLLLSRASSVSLIYDDESPSHTRVEGGIIHLPGPLISAWISAMVSSSWGKKRMPSGGLRHEGKQESRKRGRRRVRAFRAKGMGGGHKTRRGCNIRQLVCFHKNRLFLPRRRLDTHPSQPVETTTRAKIGTPPSGLPPP